MRIRRVDLIANKKATEKRKDMVFEILERTVHPLRKTSDGRI